MQYIKALVLVVVFFLAMVFLCQNQVALSKGVALQLDLMFLPATPTVNLPFYFVVIAAFLLGGVCCFIMLMWDRVRMSARAMRASWRVRALQNEQLEMVNQIRQLAQSPAENRPALYDKFKAGYDSRVKAREEDRKKNKKEFDIKQMTIDAQASATPSTGA